MRIKPSIAILLLLAALGVLFGGTVKLEREMAGKTQKKSEKSKHEAFKAGGADVLISRSNDREVLQIDGRIAGFHKTENGYRLKSDVYQKPAKSLRAAVERHLKSEAVK